MTILSCDWALANGVAFYDGQRQLIDDWDNSYGGHVSEKEPFSGFGDPVLKGSGDDARKRNIAALYSRDAVADANEVRKLARLPESAGELRAIAAALEAAAASIRLGAAATERAVRAHQLQGRRAGAERHAGQPDHRHVHNGEFSADASERALDKLTMLLQRAKDWFDRSLCLSDGDTSGLTMILPSVALRASKYLAFDAGGTPIAVTDAAGGVPPETLVAVIDTVAVLKALTAPATAMTSLVRGFTMAGDGGGGFYWWNSADATADNGGTIIQLDIGGGGRFNKPF